ncbi:Nucleotide-diphospho-sugar transferase [Gracilaria domingensis]|nr:Nucleotide-diphospho-sugar transferase [Gracilaria domingensis]
MTDPAASSAAPSQPSPFYAVYLAAGLSSRFGYRIKCLQPVGRCGETLLELSVRQLLNQSVSAIVIIVSDATYKPIHDVVADNFMGLPVRYAFQVTPPYRKKPLGTVAALLSAKNLLDKPFIVLNGDTLYGHSALERVCTHIKFKDTPCMPGYPLRDVLPQKGKVNRAIICIEGSCLTEIVEQYNVGMDDIRSGKYSGDELTSMNIFGFQPSFLQFAQRKFDAWIQQNPTDDTSEYILSTMLNDLLPEQGVKTCVYGVENSIPLELTNPEDFAYVRNNLDLVGL